MAERCKNLVYPMPSISTSPPLVCGGEIATAEFQVLGRIEIERFCLSCGSSPDLEPFVVEGGVGFHKPGSGLFHI